MKKFMVMAFVSMIVMLALTSCDEENEDPPAFTNGLMVTFGDISYDIYGNWKGLVSLSEITARKYVNCAITWSPGGNKADFTAETADGKTWNVVFQYDPSIEKDTIWISDNTLNKIRLVSDDPAWNYYMDYSINDEFRKKTFINIIKLVPDTIFEARFGGYFFKQGTTTQPDSLIGGYIHTTKFGAAK